MDTTKNSSISSGPDNAIKCVSLMKPINIERLTKKMGTNNRKRRKTDAELDEEAPIESKLRGKQFTISTTTFYDVENLFTTDFKNYTLITTRDFTPYVKYAPTDLMKELEETWHYGVHVSYGMQPMITRKMLKMRVIGGQILAYKYTECSIEGNECVYYGFIPTQKNNQTLRRLATHTKCRISAIAIWPRKLYIYARYLRPCPCSENCGYWIVTLQDGKMQRAFCVKKIPWSECYIMMGEPSDDCSDKLRPPRICAVCAQCYDCSRKPTYCRKHRVCKHKFKSFTLDDASPEVRLKKSAIKNCQKIQ